MRFFTQSSDNIKDPSVGGEEREEGELDKDEKDDCAPAVVDQLQAVIVYSVWRRIKLSCFCVVLQVDVWKFSSLWIWCSYKFLFKTDQVILFKVLE